MKEQLSALMDSELSEADALRLIKSMKNDDALQTSWDAYHLLGDVLRKSPPLSPDFNASLMRRLAQEPTVLAPRRERLSPAAKRQFPLSIAASVAAVSLVSILALQITRLNQNAVSSQVAAAPAAQQVALVSPQPKEMKHTLVAARTPAQVKFTTATPSAYLLAHQEFSPSYAPAYVRVVSEQRDSRQ